jgi:hypothetical protein
MKKFIESISMFENRGTKKQNPNYIRFVLVYRFGAHVTLPGIMLPVKLFSRSTKVVLDLF